MKKIIPFISGIALYLVAMLFLTGYGNLINHPTITYEVVKKFVSMNNKGSLSMPKFKNYFFNVDFQGEGPDIEKSVMFYKDLPLLMKQSKLSVIDWIARGSLLADVPEVQASVRHFYDPTMPQGQRHLQDVAIGPIMTKAQEIYPNPSINDLEWAVYGDMTSDPNSIWYEAYNHKFTWEDGKKWIKECLTTSSQKSKDSLMILAWRALGETIHMIEDHGCPAHVRDDSHPAPMGYGGFLGDPDTYEELMVDNDQYIPLWGRNSPDPALKSMETYETILEIAHSMAVWTNKNFFTNQTIAGTNIYEAPLKHITHPSKEYPSPRLQSDDYDTETKYYVQKIAGKDVLMCKGEISLYEFLWQGKKKGYPLFDNKCVRSQAEVLIPNIVYAGVNAMRVFIPQISVKIDLFADGTVSGEVAHSTDQEYKNQIKYNGSVRITNQTYNSSAVVECKDGKFAGSLSSMTVNVGDNLVAAIDFGGIQVFSEKFKVEQSGSSEFLVKECKVFITYGSAAFQGADDTYYNDELCSYASHNDATSIFFPSEQGKRFIGSWSGKTFIGNASSGLSGGGSGTIQVVLSGDGKSLYSINLSYSGGVTDHNNFKVLEGKLRISKTIPVKDYYPDYMLEYKISDPQPDIYDELVYRIQCMNDPSKVYSLISNKPRIKDIIVRFELE